MLDVGCWIGVRAARDKGSCSSASYTNSLT